MKFDASPRPADTRTRGSRWRSVLASPPAPSRQELERDAAAQLGVPADLLGGTGAGGEATEARPAPSRGGRPRGRLAGWWRDLVSPEPAEARRQRIEAEAEAELGPHDGPAHAAR